MNHILEEITKIGIIPVIILEATSDAAPLAQALCDGELPCAEVSLTTAAAVESIRTIAEHFPEMLIGAGTVRTTEQVDRAAAAGAEFIVNSEQNPEITAYCEKKGIPVISGCPSSNSAEDMPEYSSQNSTETLPGCSTVSFLTVNQDLITAKDWAGVTAQAKEAVSKMLGFHLAHIGINSTTENEACSIASFFSLLLNQPIVEGPKNFFPGPEIEIMKPDFVRGANGHIAIETNDLARAMYHLEKRGFSIDDSFFKYDEKGNITFAYIKEEIGGFGVHFIQK